MHWSHTVQWTPREAGVNSATVSLNGTQPKTPGKIQWSPAGNRPKEKKKSDRGRKIHISLKRALLTSRFLNSKIVIRLNTGISFNFLLSQNRSDGGIRLLSKPEWKTIAVKVKKELTTACGTCFAKMNSLHAQVHISLSFFLFKVSFSFCYLTEL